VMEVWWCEKGGEGSELDKLAKKLKIITGRIPQCAKVVGGREIVLQLFASNVVINI